MKILHLNAGNETGGGMFHILSLLKELDKANVYLGVFEEGLMYKKAKEDGIQTELFIQKNRLDLSIVKQIIRFVRLNDIEIIHTHGPRANVIGSIVRSFVKCKWVVTVHSDPKNDFLGKGFIGYLFTKINIRSIKKADHVFAISERFKAILTNLYVKEDKITIIFNGIDFQKKLQPPFKRDEFGFSNKNFLVLMIARLEQVKGHYVAIKAFKTLVDKYDHCHLLLVGDGTLFDELKKYVEQENMQNFVHFLGYREDVERIIPFCDIVLLTSYSESFPLVLLEAARSSIPVITTDVGGVRRLVLNDSYGWVTEVGKVDEIAKALLEAFSLKQSGELLEKGKFLKEYASEHFSVEIFARNIYTTYKTLLKI